MSEPANLRLLADIITTAVAALESTKGTNQEEDLTTRCAKERIISACSRLMIAVRDPVQSVLSGTMGFHQTACVRAVIALNVEEVLRESGVGSEGLHVSEIARIVKVDSTTLARILRFLSNHSIFTETMLDVFASNRLSNVLDSVKSVAELQTNPICRHSSNTGVVSFLEMTGDEAFKAAAYLAESLTTQNGQTPFSMAYDTDRSLFEWHAQPGNEYEKARFVSAMVGTAELESVDAILGGFNWKDLSKGSTIIDVGGGAGSSSLVIANACPEVNIVVQDRAEVVSAAIHFWEERLPSAIQSGRVKFEAHDFFTPQPPLPTTGPTIFLLRYVIHDYPDGRARQILTHLRQIGASRLIVVDMIVPHPCVSGVEAVNDFKFDMDMQVYVHANGQDRTLDQFTELLKGTGWKIVTVHTIDGSSTGQYECVPA